ncbi:MAG: YdcH family protein [Rhodospirillaceae bacterium]
MNLSEEDICHHLEALRLEHRDLDDVIARLDAETVANQLQIQRLKKRKLVLKDEIVRLEAQMYPDIIA